MEPTGKRFLLAVDVSGSMCSFVGGASSITAACASAAMSMVTMKTEKNYHILGFSTKLVPIGINPNMKLDDVMKKISSVCREMLMLFCIKITFELPRFQWVEQIVPSQCYGL